MLQLNGDDRMLWTGQGGKWRQEEGSGLSCTHTHTHTHTHVHSLSGMPPFLQLSDGQELQSVWSKH